MIFAEMDYPESYSDFHNELKMHLSGYFQRLESGLQGDSWFWIHEQEGKVAIDTFTSMKHQVKAPSSGPHVQKVIQVLQARYKVKVYAEPLPEGHEAHQA
ncbi:MULTISPECIES: hypothetical protein [unclassified Pseudomonas]|uniref:hypothetical protein n=1 Tax=unclassified Pseudomonas TaxID=196821 RepID=UPI00244ABA74|nr:MULTISPECIES: hypothetical protein [unclassified Pseudomonas]MDH0892835.1 hypothetical protein [Pseudomonas sp. GD03875]MDH1064691.1 hypothetical protein [Pseudomonas sp. GD03985]